MNRIRTFAFALVIPLGLASACGSDDEGGGSGGSNTGATGGADAATGGTGASGGSGGTGGATGGTAGAGGAGGSAGSGGSGGNGGSSGAGGSAGSATGGSAGSGGASGSAGSAGSAGASGSAGSGTGGAAGSDAGTDGSTNDSGASDASDAAAETSASAATVTSISPDNGLANQPTPNVVITGTGFASNASVVVAGVTATLCNYSGVPTSISCTVPAKGSVFRGDVVVTNPSAQPGTLADAFTFTGVLNETNLGAEADFCNLQFPTGVNATINQPSPLIYGRLFESGVTEAPGAPSQVIAQVGFGPASSGPLDDSSWRWFAATYNVQVGNDDEYQSTITVTASGSYQYTYRFSFDDGFNYTYCDSDGAGSNAGLTFSSSSLGTLIATP